MSYYKVVRKKKAIKINTSSKSFTSRIKSDGGFPARGNNKGEFLGCSYSYSQLFIVFW